MKQPFLIHNHTEFSNFRLLDSTIKVEDLLDRALEKGLPGICITDHEALSGHIRAFQHVQKEKFKDFKLGYGNEVYLVDRKDVEYARENNTRTKYYHFLLLAKNERGYKGLRELSTKAWKNVFFHRGMQRVPLYKEELKEIMKKYKGDIIASSSCIGGELPQQLLKSEGIQDDFNNEEITEEERIISRKQANNFVREMLSIFGDDFYIELQPAHRQIQRDANKLLYQCAKHYGIKPIITTDTHYIDQDDYWKHEIYLKAQQGNREVADFYKTTYLMDRDELLEFFDENTLNELIDNTWEIYDKIEEIKFGQPVQIPNAHIPEFVETTMFDEYKTKYKYIYKMLHSPNKIDRFYMYLLAEGLYKMRIKLTDEIANRINLELEQIWLLSEYFDQPMSGYFVVAKELVDIIWEVSIMAPNRGSAACYFTNYLLGIVQINPMEYDLPYWRFLHIARGEEMPDIDLDTASHKRDEVVDLVRRSYGYDYVLPMSTYMTEGNASAVQTACRGLGIPTTEAMNMSKVLTDDSIEDQYYGNPEEGIEVNQAFKNMVDKHGEHLIDLILTFNGLVKGRSQHAGGVVVFTDGYINEGNAMMQTSNGVEVTAYNADDTEFLGGLKMDLLSTDALTVIQTTMELLLEEGLIEWQGSLRETYNKYLHPDRLDVNKQPLYDLLYKGEVISAFQFSTDVGSQAIRKVKARNFNDLAAANSLMRLSVEGGEQPIDKYVKFRDNINLWYKEMEENGLTKDEMSILEKHLKVRYGICDTQELLMLIVMDVAGYDLSEANMFRKLVAKADQDALREEYELFIAKGLEEGRRKVFLDYVWNYCFRHQFSYAFSFPHIAGYTLITIQEMHLAYEYTPLYWQTACLICDSGGKESDGQKDYGKISRAANSLQGKVTTPDINKSGMTFTPVREQNKIVFGLNPIKGLRKDTLDTILEHRPFNSFDDYYERMVKTNKISEKQTIILIKAGVFNDLENKNSWDIMVDFVNRTIKPRNLNMTQFTQAFENKIIDQNRFKPHYNLYNFRKKLRKNKYIADPKSPITQIEEIEVDFDKKGRLIVDKNSFNKYYDKKVEPVREELKKKDVIERFNSYEKRKYWIEECLGNIESWEMETIGFYSKRHGLDNLPIPRDEKYGFLDMKDGEQRKLFGVVIDKNKQKNIFYLTTYNGVVAVKTFANIYNKYDEVIDNGKKGKDKIVYDESWFDRGIILMVEGRKDGNNMFTTSIHRVFGVKNNKVLLTSRKFNEEMINN